MSVRSPRMDPWIIAALIMGLGALFFPPHPSAPPLWRVAVLALAEEALFRAGLQAWLEKRATSRWGALTLANLGASAVFSLAHLAMHPPLQAMAVFFPSLIFGILWTRHKSLLICSTMHVYYNMLYYV